MPSGSAGCFTGETQEGCLINILTYHTFNREETHEMFRRSLADFRKDLAIVQPMVRTLQDVVANDDGLALTFDDAAISQWEVAMPELVAANVSATFFVPVSLVGQPKYMSWDQLRALHSKGFSIQSHGVSHDKVSEMPESLAMMELRKSADLIEREIGKRPFAFSTPFGEWTPRVAEMVEEAGYSVLRTTEPTAKDSGPYCVPSFAVKWDSDIAQFLPVTSDEYWKDVYEGKLDTEKGGHEHLRFTAIKRYIVGPNVLDVGAGYAQLCKELKAEHPEWEVTAFDRSVEAAKASKYEPYLLGSAELMPAGQWNTVIASCTLEYLQDPHAFLKRAAMFSEVVIVVVPHGQRTAAMEDFTVESVAALLGRYGEIRDVIEEHGFILGVIAT